MLAKKKLKPGQNGTKAMLDQYGEQLVCVRYRYDRARQLRLKTVELIVESTPWIHPEDQIARMPLLASRSLLQRLTCNGKSNKLAANGIENGACGTFATIKSSRCT